MTTRRSGHGLDSANFFVAAVQTGFGAFVTVYLVKNGWPAQAIGFALTIGTMSGLVSQIPAGALIDSIRDKRRPVFLGIAGVGLAALAMSVTATRSAVYSALLVQGLASSLISPGIAAISLALVGQEGLSERIGRNARFASIGNGLAAGAMGIAGSYLPAVSVFLVAAALSVPAMLSLGLISRAHTELAPATALATDQPRKGARRAWQNIKTLLLDRRLAIFAACVMLFFVASAAVGAGVAARVTRRLPDFANLIVAAITVLSQAVIAAISPWIGRRAEISGRRPLLLLGWGLLPLQGLLYATLAGWYALVLCQLLNAISGAVFGVMMPVVAADLTRRTGWFNLTLGVLGVAIAVGASISTLVGGLLAAALGPASAALGLALVGLCGLVLVFAGMPETRSAQYDRAGLTSAI